jgi:hypothetical protein
MKKSKLLWATLMSFMVVACLISVPALSGENPWDADGGNGGGTGTPLDTVVNEAAVFVTQPPVTTPEVPPAYFNDTIAGWLSRASMRVSFFIMNNFSQRTSKKAQINRPAY